jgi:ribose 5-phosphate isomerase B
MNEPSSVRSDSSGSAVGLPRFAAGADHAGVKLKDLLVAYLRGGGYEVLDLGTHGDVSVDYPDYGAAVAHAVLDGSADLGLCVCGSGIGIAMAATRAGARAATVHDVTSARLSREHNDANVLCLGERFTGVQVAIDAVEAFATTPFGGGRHQSRVDKIEAIIPPTNHLAN